MKIYNLKCKLLDGTIHEYYVCSKYRDAEYTSYKNMNLTHLGIGTIYSVNNIKQNFKELLHFWKIKGSQMSTNKEQLQQKIANMEAELAEIKLLLSKPEPTINYWQPSETEPDYYYISPTNTTLANTLNPKNDRSTRYRVFQTEAEAQKYADYIKAEETIRKAIAEANEGWLPDWSNYDKSKFVIALTYGKIDVREFRADKYLPNFMYIKSKQLAKQLIRDYEQEFITYLSY